MKRIYVNEKWCLGCCLYGYRCTSASSCEDGMAQVCIAGAGIQGGFSGRVSILI